MREILFRGKDLQEHNGWLYGYFYKSDINKRERESGKATLIFTPNCDTFVYVPEYHNSWMVKPETLGQYTGLKDKNGTRIFEGDIIKQVIPHNLVQPFIFTVNWCEECVRKKEKYEELKSKGICTQCRKEKATPGFVSCKICREKDRIRAQVYRSGRAKRNAYDKLPFDNKTTDTLNSVYEEVARYNKEHGTKYSYGYYSALKLRGLI